MSLLASLMVCECHWCMWCAQDRGTEGRQPTALPWPLQQWHVLRTEMSATARRISTILFHSGAKSRLFTAEQAWCLHVPWTEHLSPSSAWSPIWWSCTVLEIISWRIHEDFAPVVRNNGKGKYRCWYHGCVYGDPQELQVLIWEGLCKVMWGIGADDGPNLKTDGQHKGGATVCQKFHHTDMSSILQEIICFNSVKSQPWPS